MVLSGMAQDTVKDVTLDLVQHARAPCAAPAATPHPAPPSSDISMTVINRNVFHGVQYPSAMAAELAHDAWNAAQRYYELFFTCMNNDHTSSGTATRIVSPFARSHTGTGPDNLGDDSFSGAVSSPSRQSSSGYEPHHNTGNTPNNVPNTNYHTFFPPVLSAVHRQRIMETILGRAPLPWRHWRWHSSKEYHTPSTCAATGDNNDPSKNITRNNSADGVDSNHSHTHRHVHISSSRNCIRASQGNQIAADDSQSVVSLMIPNLADSTRAVPTRTTKCHGFVNGGDAEHATSDVHYLSSVASAFSFPLSSTDRTYTSVTPRTHQHQQQQPSLSVPSPPSTSPPRTLCTPGRSESNAQHPSMRVMPDTSLDGTAVRSVSSNAQLSRDVSFTSAATTRRADVAVACEKVATTAVPPPRATSHSVDLSDSHHDPATYILPTSLNGPEYFRATAEDGTKTLIIIMVGLPARGKTFLAQKICRLLNWHGSRAKVQNLQVAWRRLLLDSKDSTNDSHHSNNNSNSVGESCANDGMRRERDSLSHTHNTASSTPSKDPALVSSSVQEWTSMPLTTAHFRDLLLHPDSEARRLYSDVLDHVVRDCQDFFAHAGEVVVINDDFVTEDLRREAERRLRPLASQLIFMEVLREEEDNTQFNKCKIKDPTEYPESSFSACEAKEDFHARLALLKRVYEPLHVSAAATSSASRSRADNSSHRVECHSASTPNKDCSSSNSDDDSNTVCARSSDKKENNADDARARHSVLNKGESRQRSYIQIRYPDVVETHGISGYAASRVVSYAMNLTQAKMQHPIYFARHGESCYNRENRIGGDPPLTEQGLRDAAALAEFISALKTHLQVLDSRREHSTQRKKSTKSRTCNTADAPTHGSTAEGNDTTTENSDTAAAACSLEGDQDNDGDASHAIARDNVVACGAASLVAVELADRRYINASLGGKSVRYADNLEIWTSQLRRAIQTAELSERLLNIKTLRWSSLNEIHAGVCEDTTYEEVKERYPLIDYFRKQNKYTFRYPDGESYQDLVIRLQPVIMELENANKVVVVVAHQAILRCLLAYFGSTSAERSVKMSVPHRTIWRCTYNSKGIAKLDELFLDNLDVGF